MRRKVLGMIGGLCTGVLIIIAAEAINGFLHPLPPGLDPSDVEKFKSYIARQPSGVFVLVLCGHALASIAAGAVATLVARRTALWPAITAGVLLGLGGLINVLGLPHPPWFVGLDLACYVPLAWLGARLVFSPQAASGAGSAGV
jgi:hypothetical protein